MSQLLVFRLICLFLCIGCRVSASPLVGPVDVVYLWVDGNDPDWQEIKQQYCEIYGINQIKKDALENSRFADHNELKYSLRSVWKHASFVNHIFIVTMNQRPDWLADHPKITIVDHSEIFLNPQHLPTFNSMAIESNLHHIPALSEHLIYFNDDVFLGRDVRSSDFFTTKGKVRVFFEKTRLPKGSSDGSEISFLSACRNTNQLLNQFYKKESRYMLSHAPFALLKSAMKETVNRFKKVFEDNSSHRFRTDQDFAITNGLYQYDWMYQRKAVKGKLSNKMVFLYGDDKINKTSIKLENLICKRPYTFCLQDCIEGERKKTEELLYDFFELLYPEPGPWEKLK